MCLRPPMASLGGLLGTRECGDTFFHGRRSHVVCYLEALPELVVGTAELFLTPLLLLIILLNALRSRTPG